MSQQFIIDKIMAKQVLAEKQDELARAIIHFEFLRNLGALSKHNREISTLQLEILFIEKYIKFLQGLLNVAT